MNTKLQASAKVSDAPYLENLASSEKSIQNIKNIQLATYSTRSSPIFSHNPLAKDHLTDSLSETPLSEKTLSEANSASTPSSSQTSTPFSRFKRLVRMVARQRFPHHLSASKSFDSHSTTDSSLSPIDKPLPIKAFRASKKVARVIGKGIVKGFVKLSGPEMEDPFEKAERELNQQHPNWRKSNRP